MWTYRVRLEGEDLLVRATVPSPRSKIIIEDVAFEFVADYRARCRDGRCELTYRFRLHDAAAEIDEGMIAFVHRGVVLAPVSTWLMRPDESEPQARYRVEIDPGDGSYAFGLERAQDGASHTYEAEVGTLARGPFAAFGKKGAVRTSTLSIGGGEVVIATLPDQAGSEALMGWIEEAARDATAYYGRFPVPRVVVFVLLSSGDRFGYGMALGNGGASIVMRAGEETSARAFERDWQMTHEMLHLGFPNLLRRHHWLEEGMATYVEPIVRARRGRMALAKMWTEHQRGFEKGLPRSGDQGLDLTHTWGRTYWGGALFCFLADLQIRKQTGNRKSFDDVSRAILEAGGDIRTTWSIDQVLEVGDRATGTTVLAELYRTMALAPGTVSLEAIFERDRKLIDEIARAGHN
jgi:predicted metalloprotease with PDZ domain